MKARHVPDLFRTIMSRPGESSRPGDFDFVVEPSGQRRMWFVCPGPCKSLTAIAIRPVVDGATQSWEWDGRIDAPTLAPSLNHVGCWHGFLSGGEFHPC